MSVSVQTIALLARAGADANYVMSHHSMMIISRDWPLDNSYLHQAALFATNHKNPSNKHWDWCNYTSEDYQMLNEIRSGFIIVWSFITCERYQVSKCTFRGYLLLSMSFIQCMVYLNLIMIHVIISGLEILLSYLLFSLLSGPAFL